MNFVICLKGGKDVTGNSKRLKGTFVRAYKLKKFFTTQRDIRRNANALYVGIVDQFVYFGKPVLPHVFLTCCRVF